MTEKAKPIHTIRFGAIQAAVWSNPGQHGPFYNVTIERRYKEGEEWRSSSSFARDDLMLVAKAANAAHTYICERQTADRSSQNGHGTEDSGREPQSEPAAASAGRRQRAR